MRRRPGPLEELSLDRFLSPNPIATITPTKSASRVNKRSLSPGSPAVFSPAKRQILNQEGIFVSAATLKSPISSYASRRAAASYFHELLQGPDSPVKRLDFSPARATPGNHVPLERLGEVAVPRTVTLASPSSTSKPHTRDSSTQSALSYPDLPCECITKSKTVVPASFAIGDGPEAIYDDCFSPRSNSVTHRLSSAYNTLLIPRELISSDPQSIHHPGFNVFLDTHDLFTAASVPAFAVARCDKGPARGTENTTEEVVFEKENIAPRSRSSRAKCAALSLATPPTSRSQRGVSLSDEHRRNVLPRESPSCARNNPGSKRIHDTTRAHGETPLPGSQLLRVVATMDDCILLAPSRSFAMESEK